jgi:high-affinity nickel-transport protein
MTLVDSLDSVLMLYAYAGPTQDPTISKFALTFNNDQKMPLLLDQDRQVEDDQALVPTLLGDPNAIVTQEDGTPVNGTERDASFKPAPVGTPLPSAEADHEAGPTAPQTRAEMVLASKANTISSLSITLTLLSILVALR